MDSILLDDSRMQSFIADGYTMVQNGFCPRIFTNLFMGR